MLHGCAQEDLASREAELLEQSQAVEEGQSDAAEAHARVSQLQAQLRQMEATLLEDSGKAHDSEELLEKVRASRPRISQDGRTDEILHGVWAARLSQYIESVRKLAAPGRAGIATPCLSRFH